MRSHLLPAFTAISLGITLFSGFAAAQNATSTTTGGSVTGGSVTGGSVKGGSVTGGSVTGGSVTGSSVKGGDVRGGNVTGGSVTGGSVTGGTVTPGTVTQGSVTQGTVSPGTATAIVGNREVKATADGTVSVHSEGSSAVVTIGSHTVTVEKDRLLLNGKERARLPADTAKVGVEASKKHLTVRADGAEVLTTDLEKEE